MRFLPLKIHHTIDKDKGDIPKHWRSPWMTNRLLSAPSDSNICFAKLHPAIRMQKGPQNRGPLIITKPRTEKDRHLSLRSGDTFGGDCRDLTYNNATLIKPASHPGTAATGGFRCGCGHLCWKSRRSDTAPVSKPHHNPRSLAG